MELYFAQYESVKNLVNKEDIFQNVIVGKINLFELKPKYVENIAYKDKKFITFLEGFQELQMSRDDCTTILHPVIVIESVQLVTEPKVNADENSKILMEDETNVKSPDKFKRNLRSKTIVKSEQPPPTQIVPVSQTPKVTKTRAPYGSKTPKKDNELDEAKFNKLTTDLLKTLNSSIAKERQDLDSKISQVLKRLDGPTEEPIENSKRRKTAVKEEKALQKEEVHESDRPIPIEKSLNELVQLMKNQQHLHQQQILKPSVQEQLERAEPFHQVINQLQQSLKEPQKQLVVQQIQQQLAQYTSQQQLEIPMTPHIQQQLNLNHLEGLSAQQIQQQLIYPTPDMYKVMYQRMRSQHQQQDQHELQTDMAIKDLYKQLQSNEKQKQKQQQKQLELAYLQQQVSQQSHVNLVSPQLPQLQMYEMLLAQ